VDRLIEDNPEVNPEQLREAQELLKKLRREGVERPSYDIRAPYERRPVTRHRSPRDRELRD